MLTRRLSSGVLRARAQAQAQAQLAAASAPAVPAIPARFVSSKATASAASTVSLNVQQTQQQGRGLASAVLLSGTKTDWKSKTVKTLKQALGERGLSVSGNKADLIKRIESFETSPTSPQPKQAAGARRNASSSQPRKAAKEEPTPDANAAATILTDAEVNVQKQVAAEPVSETTAPGVPEEKDPLKDRAPTLDIKVPQYDASGATEAIPPFAPDNFDSKAEDSMAPPEPTASSGPKVMTVSAAGPEINESPRHALHETVEADHIDVDAPATSSDGKSISSISSRDLDVTAGHIVASGGSGLLSEIIGLPQVSGGKEFHQIDRATHYLVTLKRSPIGLPKEYRETLEALGLHDKLHRSVLHRFSATTAGQILKVKELVSVHNVTEQEGLAYIKRKKGEDKGWETDGRRVYGGRQ